MIAHVAAAAEQRGRVVLQLTSAQPNRVALAAAIRVAKAFESEIESLFVEDQGLYDCAGLPFACEIPLHGRERRPLSTDGMERQLRHMAAAIGRELAVLARIAEVPLHQTVVREEPVAALAKACAERGPWNVIALGNTVENAAADLIRGVFETVMDTTGIVFAGPRARHSAGPIVLVVEDVAHVETMLRAAERLQPDESGPGITILLLADSEEKFAVMDGQVRLLLGGHETVRITHAVIAEGGERALFEVLRRLGGSFLIGQFGGRLVPASGDLRHLIASLECPLFLVR
jgi:hypothetical protein